MGNFASHGEIDPAQKKLNDGLLLACERADLQEAERLLNKGADVNCQGQGTQQPWTEEDTEKLRAQGTSEGAMGSAKNIEWYKDVRAHPRRTPLHIAAPLRLENVALVRLLLDRKANPNAKNRLGQTPIELAANVGKRQVVELLAAHGAKTDQRIHEALTRFEKFREEIREEQQEVMEKQKQNLEEALQ
jgi:hypothetical protein